MTRYSEVASRYATALYGLAKDSGSAAKVFEDIRALKDVFEKDQEIQDFMLSPLVQPSERIEALEKTFGQSGLSEEVKQVLLLLAEKNRLGIFSDLVAAYQDQSDQANEVTRGTVRSAYTLSPEERTKIEEIVKKATGKNVILSYSEDPNIIGGLVAQVGSYTFDDSIESHLRRMKEELNRRAH